MKVSPDGGRQRAGEPMLVPGVDARAIGAKLVDPGEDETAVELGMHVGFLSIAGNLIDTLN
jgi:hypothetical protein